jgi:hypothetical protein
MAQSRLPMRKIRDVLRLSAAGLSKRQIAASLGIGPTAAGACLRRAREASISWPLPDDLGDDALERRLYPAPAAAIRASYAEGADSAAEPWIQALPSKKTSAISIIPHIRQRRQSQRL